MAAPLGPLSTNEDCVMLAASIAVENVAVIVVPALIPVAPSEGDLAVTTGGPGGTVENVHETAAGSGVPSAERTPVVSRAVYAVPATSAASGWNVAVRVS